MNEKLVKQLQEALFKFLVEHGILFDYLAVGKPISEHTSFGSSKEDQDFDFFVRLKYERFEYWRDMYFEWKPIRDKIIQEHERRID